MAVKLNPPIVEGRIRAQQKAETGETTVLRIPFQMNRAVGRADFTKIKMILKSATTNKELINDLFCLEKDVYFQNNEYWVKFSLTAEQSRLLQIGQYYKIQLAYVCLDDDGRTDLVGYYSSAGIFKCTQIKNVEIVGLNLNETNVHTFTYTGKIDLSADTSEKIYSYRFELKDATGAVVADSGEQLHDSTKDTSTKYQIDEWTTRYVLQVGKPYTIQYYVKTVNELELASPEYLIQGLNFVDSDLFRYYNFVAKNDSNSACVELSVEPKDKNQQTDLINGLFVLLRSSSEDNFSSWYQLTNFVLAQWSSDKSEYLCKDYSVSQGITYKYGIQAYNNNGIYSKIIETTPIFVDFEDMFLSDGKRQLRIKYNPKVSSFKNTILESKMDTLGGKYPFFFRNGNVKYKEFAISGLISMQMDENGEFLSGMKVIEPQRRATQELEQFKNANNFANDPWTYTDNYSNTDGLEVWDYHIDPVADAPSALTAGNFKKERDFKLEVLEWLTNGKPKLFRSASEGSYIVRLMNTSLSPNDQLSRMIHNFQCTAYEIADCNFDSLREYGMLMEEYIEVRQNLVFEQKDLTELEKSSNNKYELTGLNAIVASIKAPYFSSFTYWLKGDTQERTLSVGASGVYNFDSNVLEKTPLMTISKSTPWEGYSELFYGYYEEPRTTNFSNIESVTFSNVIQQWYGNNSNLMPNGSLYRSIGTIYFLQVQEKTYRTDVVIKNGRFWCSGAEYIPLNTEIIQIENDCYLDKTPINKISKSDINTIMKLGKSNGVDMGGVTMVDGEGNIIQDIRTSGRIALTNLNDINTLILGNGLYADIAYQEITTQYKTEGSE